MDVIGLLDQTSVGSFTCKEGLTPPQPFWLGLPAPPLLSFWRRAPVSHMWGAVNQNGKLNKFQVKAAGGPGLKPRFKLEAR